MHAAGAAVFEFSNSPAGDAFLAAGSLLTTAVVASWLFRSSDRAVALTAGPVRRATTAAVSSRAVGVLAVVTLSVLVAMVGASAPVPSAVGTFDDEQTDGAAGTAGGFLGTAFEAGVVFLSGERAVEPESTGYRRPETDTAGDRLKDEWLREGETPEGAPLPDGSVGRLDLYVYVVHGDNVEGLTDREVRQLERVWASMPVRNPDGSTGIDVHVVDGGALNESVQFTQGSDHTAYYTEAVMGPRLCRYHLVVLGEPTGKTVGWAAAPGYSSFVTGVSEPGRGGNVTNRVRVTTHELLHNVVGSMDDPTLPDGGLHTGEGWLGGDEYLSPETAAHLNETRFRGSTMYQRDICGDVEQSG